MVWSHHDVAFDEGLAVARGWAAAHGHFLPPATAVWEDFPIGVWAKNQRAAARKTLQNAELRAAGRSVPSSSDVTRSCSRPYTPKRPARYKHRTSKAGALPSRNGRGHALGLRSEMGIRWVGTPAIAADPSSVSFLPCWLAINGWGHLPCDRAALHA
ncbi:helicase associated domain-containing protein [Streptomyces sp. NPDC001635]|nr:hypothetical protein E4K10_47445 [Streptomyces sp. T1317-0309]